MRPVEAKEENSGYIYNGVFHSFSSETRAIYENIRSDKKTYCAYPVAVVELDDGTIKTFPVENVKFTDKLSREECEKLKKDIMKTCTPVPSLLQRLFRKTKK